MNMFSSALLFLSDHLWLFALAKGSLMLAATGLFFVFAAKLRLNAAARHALLLSGCVAALVVPLLALAPAVWRVGVPVAPVEAQVAPAPRVMPVVLPEEKPVSMPTAITVVPQPAQLAPAAPAWHLPPTMQLALWLWLCGAAVVLMPLLVAYARLCLESVDTKTPIPAVWQAWLAQESAKAGVRQSVRLCILPKMGTAPATFGCGRFSRIALPDGAIFWSEAEIRLVLSHELAHVRRHDWLARMAGQLLLALYWFNPLAWWTARRMGAEAEFACDERVVAGGARASAYAQCMVDMAARMSRAGGGWAAPAMPFGSFLSRRVARVLEASSNRRSLGRVSLWALVVGAGAGIFGVGCMGVEGKQAQVALEKKRFVPAENDVAQKMLDNSDVEKKVDTEDAHGLQPIHASAQLFVVSKSGNADAIKKLLASGIKVDVVDENDWRPLHWAAKGGHMDAAKVLIAGGAKASDRLKGGETPASLAEEEGYSELASYLSERAAEDYSLVALQNALVDAARQGDVVSVRRLLAAGADADAPGMSGLPLHYAAWQGHSEVVKILIAAGARVDAPDQNGNRPLHWTAMTGLEDVPQLLIAAGADVAAQDAKGRTPAMLAKEKGHLQLATYFLRQAARQSK